MRGATRGERSLMGCAFMLAALPLMGVIVTALQIARGPSAFPSPRADIAIFVVLAFVAFFGGAYVLGRAVARRFFGRSKVRFFQSYRHR